MGRLAGAGAQQAKPAAALQAKAAPQPAQAQDAKQAPTGPAEQKETKTKHLEEESKSGDTTSSSQGKTAKEKWQWSNNLVTKVNKKVATSRQEQFELFLLFRLSLTKKKSLASLEVVLCETPTIGLYDGVCCFTLF